MELTPYWKLKLNDTDFEELLNFCIGNARNKISIVNNVSEGDVTTIDEVFTFLRKNKEATVEGALLGDFVYQENPDPQNWEYWCKKDVENRFEKGIGDY